LDDHGFRGSKFITASTSADIPTGFQLGMPFDPLFEVATDKGVVIGGDLVVTVIADVFDTVLGDPDRVVSADVERGVLPDGDVLVIANRFRTVVADDYNAITCSAQRRLCSQLPLSAAHDQGNRVLGLSAHPAGR